MAKTMTAIAANHTVPNYEVRQSTNGHVYCTCPAWKFQHVTPAKRVCRHTEAAKALHLFEDVPVRVVPATSRQLELWS